MANFAKSGNVPEVTRCNTCKASFSSVDMVRQHYKSDWHVFNSKRRSSGLTRATWEEYKKLSSVKSNVKKSSTSSSLSNKYPNSSAMSSPNKLAEEVKRTDDVSMDSVSHKIPLSDEATILSTSLADLAANVGIDSKERLDKIVSLAVENVKAESDEDKGEEDEEDEGDIIIEDNISLFDDKLSDTVEENVSYMERNFGFFVPEREHVADLSALIIYLGEKIKLGGICIYCQKQFGSGRSCQDHMRAKSHCKIAYEEDIDLDEFDDFYDSPSTYSHNNLDVYENSKDEADMEEYSEPPAIGELLLADGRCLGHRAFRKYYRQKYKPPESRMSVIVARKEELLKLYKNGRYAIQKLTNGRPQTQAIAALSDADVMSLIVQQHKEQKKFDLIAQRAEKRLIYANNRREYKSVTDKLRSSATTTAKIRDYHSMLC